jgi:hypothetical protein
MIMVGIYSQQNNIPEACKWLKKQKKKRTKQALIVGII